MDTQTNDQSAFGATSPAATTAATQLPTAPALQILPADSSTWSRAQQLAHEAVQEDAAAISRGEMPTRSPVTYSVDDGALRITATGAYSGVFVNGAKVQ